LRAILQDELDRQAASGQPGLAIDDWLRFRVNPATRTATLMIAYFSALEAVVEGWKINGLADARVDELLRSPHAQTLAGFRNALVHPRSIVDDRLKAMHADRKQVLKWAARLADTFELAFNEWYSGISAEGGNRQG
jgi:hypothetical protein